MASCDVENALWSIEHQGGKTSAKFGRQHITWGYQGSDPPLRLGGRPWVTLWESIAFHSSTFRMKNGNFSFFGVRRLVCECKTSRGVKWIQGAGDQSASVTKLNLPCPACIPQKKIHAIWLPLWRSPWPIITLIGSSHLMDRSLCSDI